MEPRERFAPFDEKYHDWVELSDEDLIERFDHARGAQNPAIVAKVLIQDRYLAELARRDAARREQRMVELTEDMHRLTAGMHRMTKAIVGLTIVNAVFVLISIVLTIW